MGLMAMVRISWMRGGGCELPMVGKAGMVARFFLLFFFSFFFFFFRSGYLNWNEDHLLYF